jgi:hypothetical protein
MADSQDRFEKECKPRESREVCHQAFWCGQERAYGINLSYGGMCFRVARRAEPGELVLLHHGPGLRVKARIAWTRRLDKCVEVGVQFLDQEEVVKEWLKFLQACPDEEKMAQTEEPVLALPAPGQTYQPSFTTLQWNNRNAGSIHSTGSGTSWKAAVHLMGGSRNGNG